MEFNFRGFKEPEFESHLLAFFRENNVNTTGEVLRFDRDGDNTKATVRDSLIDQLNELQIDELRAIK